MKARVYGFEWTISGLINLGDYLQDLQGISGREISNRVIAVTNKQGYHAGLFLTIKDIRAYCKMKKDGRRFTLSAQELEAGSSMADFNFFVINSTTGRGLYQHYHQSAMPNTFCMFAKQRYNFLLKSMFDKELEENGGKENIQAKKLKSLHNKYKGTLNFSTLVRQDSFEACVSAMDSISCFEFELTTITEHEKLFSPMSRYAKKSHHKVHFINPKNPDSKRSVSDFVGASDLKRGRAVGLDEGGNVAIYKFCNDYLSFDEYDYNNIVNTINIDSNNLVESLNNSFIINELLDICNRQEVSALLSAPAR